MPTMSAMVSTLDLASTGSGTSWNIFDANVRTSFIQGFNKTSAVIE